MIDIMGESTKAANPILIVDDEISPPATKVG